MSKNLFIYLGRALTARIIKSMIWNSVEEALKNSIKRDIFQSLILSVVCLVSYWRPEYRLYAAVVCVVLVVLNVLYFVSVTLRKLITSYKLYNRWHWLLSVLLGIDLRTEIIKAFLTRAALVALLFWGVRIYLMEKPFIEVKREVARSFAKLYSNSAVPLNQSSRPSENSK